MGIQPLLRIRGLLSRSFPGVLKYSTETRKVLFILQLIANSKDWIFSLVLQAMQVWVSSSVNYLTQFEATTLAAVQNMKPTFYRIPVFLTSPLELQRFLVVPEQSPQTPQFTASCNSLTQSPVGEK